MNRMDWLRYRLQLQLQQAKLESVDPDFEQSLEDVVHARPDQVGEMLSDKELGLDLNDNVAMIRRVFGDEQSPDLVVRQLPIEGANSVAVVYFSTMAGIERIADEIIRPIFQLNLMTGTDRGITPSELRARLHGALVHNGRIFESTKLAEVVNELMAGKSVLLIDGDPHATLIGTTRFDRRGVEPPESEVVIRGPRVGFTEELITNVSLIRRRLASPLLRMELSKVGRWTQTELAMLYVEGLTNPELITEVRRRLAGIDIDGVLESEYLEELIEDQTFTIFPQVYSTERPDVAVAQLLEGRVVILTNGTPFALVAPGTFNMFMQSPSDYYQRWDYGSLVRFMRWIMVGAVVYFTAIYVAITSFSQSMLPTGLLISFAAAREKVPFTVLTEAIVLETVFEVLREAGIRLPRQIGQTISIVGVLVIGQAAVQASIISAPMVIIVAFTGIASFVVPHYNFGIPLRILRFPMIILGGTMGLFGIVMGTIVVIVHLLALRSFGVPYLLGVSPPTSTSFQDTLMRLPHWTLLRRPSQLRKATTWRVAAGQQPNRGQQPDHAEVSKGQES